MNAINEPPFTGLDGDEAEFGPFSIESASPYENDYVDPENTHELTIFDDENLDLEDWQFDEGEWIEGEDLSSEDFMDEAFEVESADEMEEFYETEFVPAADFEGFDGEIIVDRESTAYKRLKSIRARPAPAPCAAASPSPGGGAGSVRSRDRVPDYRPGAGRIRRRRSRPYIKWVQRSLNQVLGTALAVDGLWGRRTSRALRLFQKRAGIQVDGKIGPQSEAALRKWTRTEPPQREVPFEGVAPAAAAAAGASALGVAKFALDFVKFGVDIIQKIVAGGIKLIAPRDEIGIRVTNKPSEFLLQPIRKSLLIFNYQATIGGVEAVRVKLECTVVYDGLNLQARFAFQEGGDRSRLGANTVVKIDKPFDLENARAPQDWQRCGVADYRILRIPITIRIDRPWPLSNYNENFELLLSNMYGFGASGNKGRAHIRRLSTNSN